MSAISFTATSKAAVLSRLGFVVPLILRTYWTAAATISSSVAGGLKLWRVRMFRHIVSRFYQVAGQAAAELVDKPELFRRSSSAPTWCT